MTYSERVCHQTTESPERLTTEAEGVQRTAGNHANVSGQLREKPSLVLAYITSNQAQPLPRELLCSVMDVLAAHKRVFRCRRSLCRSAFMRASSRPVHGARLRTNTVHAVTKHCTLKRFKIHSVNKRCGEIDFIPCKYTVVRNKLISFKYTMLRNTLISL